MGIREFLKSFPNKDEASQAEQFLNDLEYSLRAVPSDPAAYQSEDGHLELAWRNDRHYFIVEFGEERYWFYHNLKTDVILSSEKNDDFYSLVNPLGAVVFFR